MRDRSMRSGTKFAREIQLTDWSTAGNLSNRSSGVQIPRDICTRFRRYLYSRRCSWIIIQRSVPEELSGHDDKAKQKAERGCTLLQSKLILQAIEQIRSSWFR